MRADHEAQRRVIDFAGRRWWVKRADEPTGPGNNRFDDSIRSVEVNSDGSLSLRIHSANGRWLCAEVVGEEITGYGRYEWTVASDLSRLERHVVVGMFTWSEDPDCANREIDIEVSAWKRTDGVVGKFVVQPSECEGHTHDFTVPRTASWTCSFDWTPGLVGFRAAGGAAWPFDGPGVPTPGNVHPRINLWLYKGEPLGSAPIEVRVGGFRFTPQGA